MTNKELITTLTKSAKTLNKPLTQALRKDALSAGWPVALTKQLRVVITNTSMDVEYPENLASRVEDLEYGDGVTPPSPVFRKFAKANKIKIENALVDTSIDYLFDEGILP